MIILIRSLNSVILIFLLSTLVFGGQTASISPQLDLCITIQEEDGSPKNDTCKPLKVTNGTLTNNGSYFSLSITGGSSSSCWEEDSNSDLMPVSGSCTDTFWEEDGNGDLQPKA